MNAHGFLNELPFASIREPGGISDPPTNEKFNFVNFHISETRGYILLKP